VLTVTTIFQAMSACQRLHPDQQSSDGIYRSFIATLLGLFSDFVSSVHMCHVSRSESSRDFQVCGVYLIFVLFVQSEGEYNNTEVDEDDDDELDFNGLPEADRVIYQQGRVNGSTQYHDAAASSLVYAIHQLTTDGGDG
jgi:hypothetical protein